LPKSTIFVVLKLCIGSILMIRVEGVETNCVESFFRKRASVIHQHLMKQCTSRFVKLTNPPSRKWRTPVANLVWEIWSQIWSTNLVDFLALLRPRGTDPVAFFGYFEAFLGPPSRFFGSFEALWDRPSRSQGAPRIRPSRTFVVQRTSIEHCSTWSEFTHSLLAFETLDVSRLSK